MRLSLKRPLAIWTFAFIGSFLGSACSPVNEAVDSNCFSHFGFLVFDDPPKVTFKEIHLDGGNLLGQKAIVEGQVTGLGKHMTHLILNDDTARMLVVLTKTWKKNEDLVYKHNDRVSVYGVIERGQRGLPYIEALATHLEFAKDGSTP